MTSKERLLRTLRREEVDRVPISPRYFDYLRGVYGCNVDRMRVCVQHCIWWRDNHFDHDLMPIYQPLHHNYLLDHTGPYDDLPDVSVEMTIKDTGGETVEVHRRFTTPAGILTDRRSVTKPGSVVAFPHIIEAPVKDRSDLEKIAFLVPSPEQSYIGDVPLMQEAVGDKGLLLFSPTQGVDQFLLDALGVENALLMYYDDRELIVELLRIFGTYHRSVLKHALEQGVEVVFEPWYNCSMSVGWSPNQFRELFLPLIKKHVELVHSYGAYVDYYDDGRMSPVLEDLAGAGIDIIETLSPAPVGRRRLGRRQTSRGRSRVPERARGSGQSDLFWHTGAGTRRRAPSHGRGQRRWWLHRRHLRLHPAGESHRKHSGLLRGGP